MTRIGIAISITLLMVQPGFAQKVVPESFQVNSTTAADQEDPAVCRADNGSFVIIWEDEGGADGDQDGIFGQRFDSDGDEVGDEFLVNAYTISDQKDPAVCCNPSGDFVVVWESRDQDGDQFGVFGQRFTSNGMKVGDEFMVNTYTDGDQEDEKICCSDDGSFVVAWESDDVDNDDDGIAQQRFDSLGEKIGSEMLVNTFTTNDQDTPDICCAGDGRFVIVWESEGQDGDDEGVFGQRYNSDGAKVGGEFQVNTLTEYSQDDPAICCAEDGNFVVAWVDNTNDDDIRAQRYNSDGDPEGEEFVANQETEGDQDDPDVACDSFGAFAVAWDRGDVTTSVSCRAFGANGAPSSSDVTVGGSGNNISRSDPELALGDDGVLVTTLVAEKDEEDATAAGAETQGLPSGAGDGDGRGVFAALVRVGGASAMAPLLSPFGLSALGLLAALGGMWTLRRR